MTAAMTLLGGRLSGSRGDVALTVAGEPSEPSGGGRGMP